MLLCVVTQKITCAYLLLSHIPVYGNADGLWVDRLWAIDLQKHTDYIQNLTLAAPLASSEVPPGYERLSSQIQFIALPASHSYFSALRNLPRLVIAVWHSVGRADVVHSSPIGWPIPPGWIAVPIAKLRRKFILVMINSATWRIAQGTRPSLAMRLLEKPSEILARWSVAVANLPLFTHKQYQLELSPKLRGNVINASWVEASNIISEDAAIARWSKRIADNPPLSVLFASRPLASKGLDVLINASRDLDNVLVSIMGTLELPAIPYGEQFFRALANYDAVIVPSLTDEQPRIVYDAYSQGIPVIASATPGLSECVQDGQTGRLFTTGASSELAHLLQWAAHNRPELMRLGLNGLKVIGNHTHTEMHRQRLQLLSELLPRRALTSN